MTALLELEDGSCLAESDAILFYLANGTPFLPSDRLDRARAAEIGDLSRVIRIAGGAHDAEILAERILRVDRGCARSSALRPWPAAARVKNRRVWMQIERQTGDVIIENGF